MVFRWFKRFIQKSVSSHNFIREFHSPARLTPQEVSNILQANEFAKEFNAGGSIKSYDSNQLASNDPIEDTRNEAICLYNNGHLFGVFDGHGQYGGVACAQVVAKRLFHYIAAGLLPKNELQSLVESLHKSKDSPMKILDFYNERFNFVDVLRDIYSNSYKNYVSELANSSYAEKNVEDVLAKSFLGLDEDMSREAIETVHNVRVNLKTLSVAMSGAVSCVAYINGPHLYVASVGDCQAVLGVLGDDNYQWYPKKLNIPHNADNEKEVERIRSEHPRSESTTVIEYDRLLGQLQPLRAFGDFFYKWPREQVERIAAPHFGNHIQFPREYHTPPYLTARPEVMYHHLSPKDKFLVLATDGLWDFMTPLQVVRMVGEHMRGKTTLTPFRLPRSDMTLGDINEALLVRKECLSMKPLDKNACTHLIRNAIGGTEYGLNHEKLSKELSRSKKNSRMYRDDISITVVYFDSEYLRQSPTIFA